jgi:hypothetical protein
MSFEFVHSAYRAQLDRLLAALRSYESAVSRIRNTYYPTQQERTEAQREARDELRQAQASVIAALTERADADLQEARDDLRPMLMSDSNKIALATWANTYVAQIADMSAGELEAFASRIADTDDLVRKQALAEVAGYRLPASVLNRLLIARQIDAPANAAFVDHVKTSLEGWLPRLVDRIADNIEGGAEINPQVLRGLFDRICDEAEQAHWRPGVGE